MPTHVPLQLCAPTPRTQCRQSKTFAPPALDGSLTIPQMYDWHLEHAPDHRLFLYADDDDELHTIYWPEAVRAILRGARMIQDRIGSASGTPIVAVLAASGIAYLLSIRFELT